MIDTAAVVYESVGNYYVGCPMDVIVPADLVEDALGQRNVWSLAFNNEKGLPLSIKNNNIGTFLRLV